MGKFRFIFGAAAGAAAALLLAPRSGRETRGLLSEKAADAAESAPEPIRNVAAAAEDLRDCIRRKSPVVSPDSDEVKEKIAEARDALAEQIVRNRSDLQAEAEVEDIPVNLDCLIEIPVRLDDVDAADIGEATDELESLGDEDH